MTLTIIGFTGSLTEVKWHASKGRWAEAELCLRREIRLHKRDPGKLAERLNALAVVYIHQGFLAKAEPLFQRSITIAPLYQRAIEIQENALGPEHPDLATSLENHAALLRAMDREDQAEVMASKAKAIREKRGASG